MTYIEINLHCIPGSKVEGIVGILNKNTLKLKIRARAVENAANLALIELISREFNVKKSNIELIRGLRSKSKTLKIFFDSMEKHHEFQQKFLSYNTLE